MVLLSTPRPNATERFAPEHDHLSPQVPQTCAPLLTWNALDRERDLTVCESTLSRFRKWNLDRALRPNPKRHDAGVPLRCRMWARSCRWSASELVDLDADDFGLGKRLGCGAQVLGTIPPGRGRVSGFREGRVRGTRAFDAAQPG